MKQNFSWYLTLLGFSAILNIIIEVISRKSLVQTAAFMFRSPVVFLLNILVVAVPFLLVLFVKRKLFVLFLISALWIGMGSINGVLLIFRTTPFTATDFRLVKYALNIATSYLSWFHIVLIAIGVLIVLIGGIFLWKTAPVDDAPVLYPVAAGFTLLSLILVIGGAKWCLYQGYVAVRYGNIGQAYRDYGFPYCFSNSVFYTGIPKPEEYDENIISDIEKKEMIAETTFDLADAETPDIIMIQLESFFDPAHCKDYQLKENPIPFFSYLREFYPSGYLSVPSVGAGTANTEFECITGMNLDFFGPGEYPYKTVLQKTPCESIAFDLKGLGYSTHAIHNNEGTFYDRHVVFSQLGFDTFTPIEYMYHLEHNPTGWCKDKVLTGEILKALDSTPEQDFIYTISVQGHGGYPDFEYYCQQIKEMDEFVKDLIVQLNYRKKPAIVVFYGDHLPGFEWTADDMENNSLYQTEYVIWNNLNITAERKDLESYQIGAYLLDLIGIHEGTMMRFHQKYFREEIKNESSYLEDMEVLEYDILYGDHQIYEGATPYQPTDLQLGTTPVYLEKAVHNGGNLLLYGENFNEYSTVCINDKPLETMYVTSQLLIVKEIDEKAWQDKLISVKQIGRDKVPLGVAGYRKLD